MGHDEGIGCREKNCIGIIARQKPHCGMELTAIFFKMKRAFRRLTCVVRLVTRE